MDRLEKVYTALRKPVDAIIIKNEGRISPNHIYITGSYSRACQNSVLVVRRESIDLVISRLEEGNEYPEHVNVHVVDRKEDVQKLLRELIPEGSTVGYESTNISYRSFNALRRLLAKRKFIDVSNDLLRARFKKDKEEIGRIEMACKIADRAMEKAIDMLEEGIKEKEISIEIEHAMLRYGADEKAFDSIVAFGENSAIPHYAPGERRLKDGDMVIIDIGANYRGYVSDLTRSFVFGKAKRGQKRMHEVIVEAQELAAESIKEGEKFAKVHRKVQKFVEENGFGKHFLHSTGHTIGIEVHDGFSIGGKSKERFVSGNVFTLEPGIYVSGFGGVRLEDVFVLERGELRQLTKAPKVVEL